VSATSNEVDLDSVRADIVDVLDRTVRTARARVRLRPRE